MGHVIRPPQPLGVAELVVGVDHAAEHDEALPVAADRDRPVHEGTVGEEQHRAAAGGDLVEELGVRVVGDVALQVVEGEVDAVAPREDAGAPVLGADVGEIEDQPEDLRVEPAVDADGPVLVAAHASVPAEDGIVRAPVEAHGEGVVPVGPAEQLGGHAQEAGLREDREKDGIEAEDALDLQAVQVKLALGGPRPVAAPLGAVPEAAVLLRRRQRREGVVPGGLEQLPFHLAGHRFDGAQLLLGEQVLDDGVPEQLEPHPLLESKDREGIVVLLLRDIREPEAGVHRLVGGLRLCLGRHPASPDGRVCWGSRLYHPG